VTATESARLRAPLAALAVALVLAALLGFVSRAVNRPPVIVGWEAEPAAPTAHATLVLRVRATDPDGDALRYAYETQQGRIVADAALPEVARYTPPRGVGTIEGRVTVTVTDTRGLTATATTSIKLEAAGSEVRPAAPTAESAPADLDTMARPMPSARPLVATHVPPAPATSSVAAPRPTTAPPAQVASRRAPANLAPAYDDSPMPAAPSPRPMARGPRDATTSTSSTSTSTATGATAPDATPPPNHAPVLDKGTTIEGLGIKSVVLAANGYDPDGDPIEYEWDTKGCFEVLSQTQSSAEVKFGYCTWGVVRLTWKDPQGLTAYAEWTISK
jgi:hypothetical protein